MRYCALILMLALASNPVAAGEPDTPLPTTAETVAPRPATLEIPDLPSADMRLSWSDFRALLQLLRAPEPKEAEKPAPPPWPWTVNSARYQLDATSAQTVAVEAVYELAVWAEEWTTIPILGSDVALSAVRLDGEAAQLRDVEGWYTLLTNTPGPHRLEVEFFTRATEREGDVTLAFPAVPAAITEARLLLGTDAAAVSSPDAANVEMQSRDGQQEARVALRPVETLQFHWRRPSRVKAPAPPPPPRITAESITQVRLSPALLEGTTQVTFDLLRGTANQFALDLPSDLVVLDVSGTGMEWSLESQPDSQRLLLALNHSASGAYPVTLRYELPLAGGTAAVALPRITARDVARQGGIVGISALRNTSVDIVEPTNGVSRTDPGEQFNLGLDWEVLHAFRHSQPDYALSVAAAVIEPRIVAETELLATLSNTALHAGAQVRYRMLRGETRRLAFSVPQDVNVLAVEGPGMDWYGVEGESGRRIEIELNEPLTDEYTVQLVMERDLDGADAEIPPLTVHDVARQSGWVGIAAAGNVKLDVGEGANGVTRIDETELPPGVREMADSPVLHAFEYQRAPFALPLQVTRLDDVAVRVAAVDAVELTTVVTDEMLITRARYWVRNNQRQFLRIDPGPGAEIWGAQVDGHAVSPARDPESANGVLLRMRKSRAGTGGLGSFPMELIYMQRPPEGGWGRRELSLEAPKTDILADRMAWAVYVPQDVRLASSGGDLEPALVARRPDSPDRGAMSLGQPETISRLREGIERFLITDINNPAASAVAQGKSFTDRAYPAASAEESTARLAGVLPVHINLPQTGVPHYFERVLVPRARRCTLT